MIFDTHAHYDDKQFDSDREAHLASLSSSGVTAVVDVCACTDSIAPVMKLAETHPYVYAAVGIHPDEVGGITPAVLEAMETALDSPHCVAVGEIGLDYYWDKESHEVQALWFRRQIEMALAHEKPIIVHSRAAAEDTLRIITALYGSHPIPNPGIIHCYAYSTEMARLYTAMGFCLGIGGVLTYQNSRKLKKVVKNISLDYLVLETDCPYLAPEPHRGSRNTSAYLGYVAEAIAAIKGITREEVEAATLANARRVFRLEE